MAQNCKVTPWSHVVKRARAQLRRRNAACSVRTRADALTQMTGIRRSSLLHLPLRRDAFKASLLTK